MIKIYINKCKHDFKIIKEIPYKKKWGEDRWGHGSGSIDSKCIIMQCSLCRQNVHIDAYGNQKIIKGE
jgi:hypothetical protein